MTTTTYARRNQNLYRHRSTVYVGPISAGFLTIAAIALLALLYLTQITKTSVFGFKAGELARQRDQILSRTQNLQIEAARLQSIQQIQNSTVVKGMVPTGQVHYVQN